MALGFPENTGFHIPKQCFLLGKSRVLMVCGALGNVMCSHPLGSSPTFSLRPDPTGHLHTVEKAHQLPQKAGGSIGIDSHRSLSRPCTGLVSYMDGPCSWGLHGVPFTNSRLRVSYMELHPQIHVWSTINGILS